MQHTWAAELFNKAKPPLNGTTLNSVKSNGSFNSGKARCNGAAESPVQSLDLE